MITPADLRPCEREVAVRVGSALTTKRIAFQLGIKDRRVRTIISAIAYKIGADPTGDDRVSVALWWNTHHPTPDSVLESPDEAA